MKKDFIKDEITGKVKRYFGKTIAKAGDMEVYRAAAVSYTHLDVYKRQLLL